VKKKDKKLGPIEVYKWWRRQKICSGKWYNIKDRWKTYFHNLFNEGYEILPGSKRLDIRNGGPKLYLLSKAVPIKSEAMFKY